MPFLQEKGDEAISPLATSLRAAFFCEAISLTTKEMVPNLRCAPGEIFDFVALLLATTTERAPRRRGAGVVEAGPEGTIQTLEHWRSM